MHAQPLFNKGLNPELKRWLYASGSLTQQLTDLAGGTFRVQPTQQYFKKMNFKDSQWMKMPFHHTSWVRESLLYGCETQPWVNSVIKTTAAESEENRAQILAWIKKWQVQAQTVAISLLKLVDADESDVVLIDEIFTKRLSKIGLIAKEVAA